jgi:hypothetical protein
MLPRAGAAHGLLEPAAVHRHLGVDAQFAAGPVDLEARRELHRHRRGRDRGGIRRGRRPARPRRGAPAEREDSAEEHIAGAGPGEAMGATEHPLHLHRSPAAPDCGK